MSFVAGHNVKIVQKLSGHRSDVTTCDIAPNFTLITGSSDKTIRLWTWRPGCGYMEREDSPLRAHKYQVTCVRVSPQGCMFASTSVDGTAVLWSVHSAGKLYTMTQVNGDAIRVCRFAPNSSVLVTAGDNGAICVWDLVHRTLIRTIFEHEGTTQSLAFTPDSQYLISACSLEFIKCWYVQDLVDTTNDSTCCNDVAKVDNAHDLGVFCADINKIITIDEHNPLIKRYRLATGGSNDEIKIWIITSKSLLLLEKTLKNCSTGASSSSKHQDVSIHCSDSYEGHNSSVTFLAYSANGTYLVSSSLDKYVKIWDGDGNCMATLQGHTRYVNCVAFTKNFTLVVSGSNDKLILVWDLTGKITLDSTLSSLSNTIASSSIGIPELQMMRNAETGDKDIKLLGKIDDICDGAINCCCFSCDGVLAVGSGDKMVRLFRVIDLAENNNNNYCPLEEMNCSPFDGHTYSVNHVEFSCDGKILATCSLDGCTNIWNAKSGEWLISMPANSMSIKVCRFSPDGMLLVTAGDDEKATVWNATSMKEITTLDGHLDAVTSACFSPDGQLIATTSFDSDFRLWTLLSAVSGGGSSNIYTHKCAHNLGVQSCDFSSSLDPIPNGPRDAQSYLLGTCGNDGLAQLWRISMPLPTTMKKATANDDDLEDAATVEREIDVKSWRTLQGHGGNVICIRFSPIVGEIVCTTGTDRQARIWSVYSAECLHVLDHDSIVTTCSFTYDCAVLAVGCLDKTVWMWKLPQQLVFQTKVAAAATRRQKCCVKALINWSTNDVTKWLKDIDFSEIIENVCNSSLDGQKILTLSEDVICSGMDLDGAQTDRFKREIKWLRRDELELLPNVPGDVPDEFLCPITHEIMREPVTCSDGFTYEKNAIAEWFMSGKYTSPMTNGTLIDTDYRCNRALKLAIRSFLDGDE